MASHDLEKKEGDTLTQVHTLQDDPASLVGGDEALKLFRELGHDPSNLDALTSKFDEAYMRRLTRKLDLILLPILAMTYWLQFLDKSTLNYASVMGLREDLNLQGNQYGSVSAAFYYGFMIAEIPTTVLAQKSGKIGTYLGCCLVLWGIVLGCTAACNSYGSLFAVRFLLGVTESCVAPVLVLLISMFYPKRSQARRVASFYMQLGFTQIIGGAAAYGVFQLDTNFANWRILFLIFAAITIIHGIITILFLPNSPVRARYFTTEEKIAILLSVKDNQSGTQNQEWKLSQALEAFYDPKILLVWFMVLVTMIPNGSLSNYTSILLTSFGHSSERSLLLQAPAGAVAIVITVCLGFLSDKINDRSGMVVLGCLPTLIGAAVLVGVTNNEAVQTFGVYLTGAYGAPFGSLLSWNASNISGYTKKVICGAMTMLFFSAGNIIGSQILPDSDAPRYLMGKSIMLAALCAAIIASVCLRFTNVAYNRKKEREVEGMDPTTLERRRNEAAWQDLSDMKNPFFRYTH